MRLYTCFYFLLQWMTNVNIVFLGLVIPSALAFPLDLSFNVTELLPLEHVSQPLPARHLGKRASSYSSIKFGKTCSSAQQQYIKTELDEIKTMLTRTEEQIRRIRSVIMDKTQPADWGTRYADNTRLLNTWNSYIHRIMYTSRARGAPNAETPKTFQATTANMQYLHDVYRRIRTALQQDTVSMWIHCNDNFLKLNTARSVNGIRVYDDTRPQGEAGQPFTLAADGKLCHESDAANGWRYRNQVTQKEEICICPNTFARTNTANLLTTIANEHAALQGKSLGQMKFQAAAGTLLHELTHLEGILGDDATGDYGYTEVNILKLAGTSAAKSMHNADTLAYFAVALYYSECDWSRFVCGGRSVPQDFRNDNGGYDRFDY